MLELHVESPLKWPQDRPRTRFQDRKPQNAWKLTYQQTIAALEREMKLSKVTYGLITHNPTGHEDAGVAVWMSRKPIDDYAWQDEFGFIGEIPTVQSITLVATTQVPTQPEPAVRQKGRGRVREPRKVRYAGARPFARSDCGHRGDV